MTFLRPESDDCRMMPAKDKKLGWKGFTPDGVGVRMTEFKNRQVFISSAWPSDLKAVKEFATLSE